MEWTLLTSGLTPRARHGLPTAVALLACATTALTAFPGPASADVGTSLAERLQTAGVDERIPVLVTLNRQVDGGRFDGDPQALITALQRTADAGLTGEAQVRPSPRCWRTWTRPHNASGS